MNDENLAVENEEMEQSFVVDTNEKADWAMKKLSEINSQIEDVDRRAKVQEQQIFDWKTNELQKLEESREYFENLLNNFTVKKLEENPKFKFSSPWGKISVRHVKEWSYNDDELIKQYKDTQFVKTSYKLNKNDLKKSVEIVNGKAVSKETGEIVDGIKIDEVEKINIKTED